MEPSRELAKLFAQALVDPAFCRQLLGDPAGSGQDFDLSDQERATLAGIRPGSLAELAQAFLTTPER
jgi:hypothetical protein